MKIKLFYLIIFSISIAAQVKNTFNVEGMMCGYGCASKIKSVITDLKGVKECDVSFEKKSFTVVYDNSNLDTKSIINSLPNPYIATLLSESITKFFAVEGITCMGCVESIYSVLEKVDGILSYSVELDGKMEIEIDINKFDEKKMYELIPEKFSVVEFIKQKEEKIINE